MSPQPPPSVAIASWRAGDRVRPSECGRRVFPRLLGRAGTLTTGRLVGPHRESLRVRWDGRTTPESFHVDYLEPVK